MGHKSRIILNNKTILITGAAGFIGANLIIKLLKHVEKGMIIGIDNLNDYYDVGLKRYRLKQIDSTVNSEACSNFEFL